MDNTELIHHGIKGQRWGVRRFQNKDGSRTIAGKSRERMEQADKTIRNKDKQIRDERRSDVKKRRAMSDEDIRKRVARMKLEQEYKDLVDSDIAPGRKFASEILSSGAKKALTVAAAGALAYGVKAAMTKEFNIKDAASYIAANPNKKK